jgi:hypothetical protein
MAKLGNLLLKSDESCFVNYERSLIFSPAHLYSISEAANVDVSAGEIFIHHHACENYGSALNNERINVDWGVRETFSLCSSGNKDFNSIWLNGTCLEQYLFK